MLIWGKTMVKIRDPLHGTVVLSDIEEKILDTPHMQRLREIRQLAMAYLVYPGANHTRFEHSIGTLFLADKICSELNLPQEKKEKVRLAALLHDVGHTAFSHEAEEILKKRIGNHEEIGKEMVLKSEIADILKEKYSPKDIVEVYEGQLGKMITTDIGADRMDYLLRDSHYTGVAYGVIDADRICGSVSFSKNGLVLHERGLDAAENLLVARFTMFSTVYLHKTVRIASRMLQHALTLALEDRTIDAKEATEKGDALMLQSLVQSGAAKKYVVALKERKLYKKAYSIRLDDMTLPAREVEKELSDKCNCTVLVDVPRLSAETEIMLESGNGGLTLLSDASELVSSLQKMQKKRLEVAIICEEKNVRKISEAAKKLLGYQSVL